jgi:hypothetical protein
MLGGVSELVECNNREKRTMTQDDRLNEVLAERAQLIKEKEEYREERYTELAEKHRNQSESSYKAAFSILSIIPPGQPILVGHHSERHHRAHLRKVDNKMRASVEHQKKAEHYERKLNSDDSSISSGDPDAVIKIESKIADLEKHQAFMKAANKAVKKAVKLETSEEKIAEMLKVSGMSQSKAIALLTPCDWSKQVGFRAWELSNNNANIRRLKTRLEEVKREHEKIAAGPVPDIEYPSIGAILRENQEVNRIQILFDGKPDHKIREVLKLNGFKWSPLEGAWQRQLNNNGRYAAKYAIKTLLGRD